MEKITTVGVDIAKSVFQVHGVDAQGNVVIRRQPKRLFCSVAKQARGQQPKSEKIETQCEAPVLLVRNKGASPFDNLGVERLRHGKLSFRSARYYASNI